MFGYPCPFCQQRLLAAPERAGQRTICPKCLKPIVIPKPDEEKAAAAPPAKDTEADEVPISSMPAADEQPSDPAVRTPIPDVRPPARIGAAVGTAADPIPLQPAPLQHAAAVLVRNPDSVADFAPPAPAAAPPIHAARPQAFAPTPAPAATPGPASDPHFPAPAAFATPAPIPEPPAFPPAGGYHAPMYPAPGRITGDHPAATLPGPSVGHNNTGGLVVFNPTDIDAADLAAELTTVISMRMKPPAEPPSDLRLTTGLWIILTACGLALWLFCMMSDVDPLRYVALIGAVELAVGYAWVAVAFGRRDVRQGFVTLVPPVWVYRAANPPYEPGYRPLRFVVAGAVLLSLYVVGPVVQPTLFAWIGFTDAAGPRPPEIVETPLMKLQDADHEKNTAAIKEQLALFMKPESVIGTAAADRPKVVDALKRLARHERGEVREDALRAAVVWAPDEAKPLVVAALKSASEEERDAAFELVTRWNDPATVAAVVARVGQVNPARVYDALEAIGKTEPGRAAIEDALLPLLRANAPDGRTDVLALAAAYGRRKALDVLEAQRKTAVTLHEQDTLPRVIEQIKRNLAAD